MGLPGLSILNLLLPNSHWSLDAEPVVFLSLIDSTGYPRHTNLSSNERSLVVWQKQDKRFHK